MRRRGELAAELLGRADVDEVAADEPMPSITCCAIGAQLLAGLVRQRDGAGRVGRRIGRQRQAIGFDLDPAAVEEPDVVEALVAELPVRPGREPVVVVAVEHDGGVVVDAGGAQERLQLLAADEVAPDRIGQLALPVDAGRARQVAGVVGIGVDVDLEEADLRVVEVLAGPVGGDEGGTEVVVAICNGHRVVAGSFEPCSTGARAVAARAEGRVGRQVRPNQVGVSRLRRSGSTERELSGRGPVRCERRTGPA